MKAGLYWQKIIWLATSPFRRRISDRAVRDQDVELRDQRQAAGWPFWCSTREKQPSPEFRVLWSTPLTLSRRRWLFDLVWKSVLQTFNTLSLSLFLSVVLRSALVWLSAWLCVYIWLCVYCTYELPECVRVRICLYLVFKLVCVCVFKWAYIYICFSLFHMFLPVFVSM